MAEQSAAGTPWTVADLVAATGGHWHNGQAPSVTGLGAVVTDSRRVGPGEVFLALRGERFDAHDFVAQVAANGAGAVIVAQPLAQPLLGPDGASVPQLVVADTRLALGDLGRFHRQQMTGLKVAALTGSSGKTTTKQMLGSILSLLGPTLMTRGNLNNDLGVPMMLLELEPGHQFAVLELGANHVGEIAHTTALVQPDVAAVLNIGTAHVGEFGGRDGIARAKSEIFTGLPVDGVAVIPAQDDFAEVIAAAAGAHHRVRFGEGGEVHAEQIVLEAQGSGFALVTPQGSVAVRLPFAGRHNIDNALAAAALAQALGAGLDAIATGLAQAANVRGRLTFLADFAGQAGLTVIDDTYNANPHSVRAAADVLCQQAGARLLVLGDIGELGDQAAAEHFALGQALAALPLDGLFATGTLSAHTVAGYDQAGGTNGQHVADPVALVAALRARIDANARPLTLLFKGSRSARMEQFIQQLEERG